MHDQRLKRCPFCGGACKTIQGEADKAVWAYGKFWRAYCTKCQARQLFHRSEAKAIAAWNHRVNVGCEEYTLEEVLGNAVLGDWVEWVAVDADGDVFGYTEKPFADYSDSKWLSSRVCVCRLINKVAPPKNFKNLIWRVNNNV